MISVIIPTFGIPQYLSNSIQSVIRQTYTEWELIIVDDNDLDTEARKQTEAIVTKLMMGDSRISYLKHPYNKNGAAARNTGIAAAKGDYISFLDSDDEYMPDRLEKCLNAINNSESTYAGVFTGCEFRRGGKTYKKYIDVKTGKHLVSTLAGNFMFCTGSNLFVRKSVIDELNGFDETFLRHQDYEFLVRLFEHYSLIAIPEILVIKNNENINVPSVEKMIAIKELYLGKYSNLINRLHNDDQNYIYHTNAVAIGERAICEHKPIIANEYYQIAKQYSPLTLKECVRKFAFQILALKKNSPDVYV